MKRQFLRVDCIQGRQVTESWFVVRTGAAAKPTGYCGCGVRALVLACLLLAPNTWAAAASPNEPVRNFVERVNQASMNLLSTEENADQRCRDLLRRAFDVPRMGQYALGKAWDRATQAERDAFLAAFEDGIVAAYLRRMRIYRGATMSFAGERPSAGGDRMAASRLKLPDSQETWIWTLRPSGESWRIVDVAIGGGSVLDDERHDYADILAANHGDINAVIAFIRKRAATRGSDQ